MRHNNKEFLTKEAFCAYNLMTGGLFVLFANVDIMTLEFKHIRIDMYLWKLI